VRLCMGRQRQKYHLNPAPGLQLVLHDFYNKDSLVD
jgi:hypothetical protein